MRVLEHSGSDVGKVTRVRLYRGRLHPLIESLCGYSEFSSHGCIDLELTPGLSPGYFEDRRPASNMDPYVVTSKIADTTLLFVPVATGTNILRGGIYGKKNPKKTPQKTPKTTPKQMPKQIK